MIFLLSILFALGILAMKACLFILLFCAVFHFGFRRRSWNRRRLYFRPRRRW